MRSRLKTQNLNPTVKPTSNSNHRPINIIRILIPRQNPNRNALRFPPSVQNHRHNTVTVHTSSKNQNQKMIVFPVPSWNCHQSTITVQIPRQKHRTMIRAPSRRHHGSSMTCYHPCLPHHQPHQLPPLHLCRPRATIGSCFEMSM